MRENPYSFANLSNVSYIETLYKAFREDPKSVDPSWEHFFEGVNFGKKALPNEEIKGDLSTYLLINAYRKYGHKAAHINPLDEKGDSKVPELQLFAFGFSDDDLEKEFSTHNFLKEEKTPLKTLVEALKKTYCDTVGFDYMGTGSYEIERFIQGRIEPNFPKRITNEEKIRILHELNRSEIFESFIHMKYPGQKRFSLEGGETLIPMLQKILEVASGLGAKEGVFGMAHRGRLNVLANIFGKSYQEIFQEFESNYIPETFEGAGDVKYHKGFESDLHLGQNSFHLFLAANPSHLEAVNPVVLGRARGLQEINHKGKEYEVLPLLIHGDASIAGQGVVYELLQLSKISGYSTYGTLHLVINNQIGFTADPSESRSSSYCTDIAKSFDAPVFHVNAEDPVSATAVCQLATEIRFQFGCDVFIDLNCYRKYGHNETDEPSFTQPRIYQIIKNKPNIRDFYKKSLIDEGVIGQEECENLEKEFKNLLDKALNEVKNLSPSPQTLKKEKPPITEKKEVTLEEIQNFARTFCQMPPHVNIHPKLKKLFDGRLNSVVENPSEPSIDWGMAELLAYASILCEKKHVRISGQDSQRGTFSHRHAVIVDQQTQEKYFPLNHLKEGQGQFDVLNSPLSEYAVLGFEYGYTLSDENSLVIWEAQYGDFANGAQIVIDQFVTSAEQKWGKTSPIALFLPHGYEGQGPEHSSARMERFLQLAGNDSLSICQCTTAAQFYHLIRRQAHLSHKRPLILFTPKMLLRFAPSLCSAKELAEGKFEEILDDPLHPEKAKKLILLTGKIYYDLVQERKKRGLEQNIACIRIEELYPFPMEKLKKMIDKYPHIKECMWVQEEHRNAGAFSYMMGQLHKLFKNVKGAARARSSSPAAGSLALHKQEHENLMKDIFHEG